MNINKNALHWIVSDDVGCSSKTIWSVMMNVEYEDHMTPLDSGDFGRCYRLIKLMPEWESRLHEVAKKYDDWTPFVENWDIIKTKYESQLNNTANDTFDLYDYICHLNKEYPEYKNK
jgi:hypothetical protein